MKLAFLLAAFLAAFLLAPLVGCGPATSVTQSDQEQEDWISLFDGETLDGWTAKITGRESGDNFGDTFRAVGGAIRVAYDAYDRFDSDFGVLFYERPFSYYRLRLEYRFTGSQLEGGPDWATRNSGIMVHSQSPETMVRDQNFPISIEVQLLGGLGEGVRTTANLCTPGTNVVMSGELITEHCTRSTSQTFHGDRWVRLEVEVLGDSLITHYVEGEPVLSYEAPQIGGGSVDPFDPAVKRDGMLLKEGYIALQSESHPVEFRNVELLDLTGCMDPSAANYRSYVVRSAPGACR